MRLRLTLESMTVWILLQGSLEQDCQPYHHDIYFLEFSWYHSLRAFLTLFHRQQLVLLCDRTKLRFRDLPPLGFSFGRPMKAHLLIHRTSQVVLWEQDSDGWHHHD